MKINLFIDLFVESACKYIGTKIRSKQLKGLEIFAHLDTADFYRLRSQKQRFKRIYKVLLTLDDKSFTREPVATYIFFSQVVFFFFYTPTRSEITKRLFFVKNSNMHTGRHLSQRVMQYNSGKKLCIFR